MGAWLGEENRARRVQGPAGALKPRVSPLRPQPRPAVGGTVALSWWKLDVAPPHTSYGQGPWQSLSPLEPLCSHLVSKAQRPLWGRHPYSQGSQSPPQALCLLSFPSLGQKLQQHKQQQQQQQQQQN